MPVNAIWGIGSTALVEWLGAKDELTNSFLNDLTITLDMTDDAGAAVPGGTALPIPHIAGSNGDYKGSIPTAVTDILEQGRQYTATITAKAPADAFRGIRKITRVAECLGPTS